MGARLYKDPASGDYIIETTADGLQLIGDRLANHGSSGRHLFGAADEIDGDRVGITFTPANYTPDTAPAEVTSTSELTAHLKGLDNAVGGPPSSHVLATTAGLGPEHTTSGLTAGQVLRASGATTAAFAVLGHSDLSGVTADQHHSQSHVLATTGGLGADHTVSGLTAGQVIRASGATAAAFAQLQHADLGGVSADQHHSQSHVLATTGGLGADHTVSGLTAGQVLRASGAAAAAFAQLQHADLGGVTADQHHAQDHAARHSDGGADEIQVENLATAATDTALVLQPDGVGGLQFGAAGGTIDVFHAIVDGVGAATQTFTDLRSALNAYNSDAAQWAVIVVTATSVSFGASITVSKGFQLVGGGHGISLPIVNWGAGENLNLEVASNFRKYIFDNVDLNFDARTSESVSVDTTRSSLEFNRCRLSHDNSTGNIGTAAIQLQNADPTANTNPVPAVRFTDCFIKHRYNGAGSSRHFFNGGASDDLWVVLDGTVVEVPSGNVAGSWAFQTVAGNEVFLTLRNGSRVTQEAFESSGVNLKVDIDQTSWLHPNQGEPFTYQVNNTSGNPRDIGPNKRVVIVDERVANDTGQGNGVFKHFVDAVRYLNGQGGGTLILRSHIFDLGQTAQGNTNASNLNLNSIRIVGESDLASSRNRIALNIGGDSQSSQVSSLISGIVGTLRRSLEVWNIDFVSQVDFNITYTGLTGRFLLGETVNFGGGGSGTVAVDDESGRMLIYSASAIGTLTGAITGVTSGATATSSTQTAWNHTCRIADIRANQHLKANFVNCTFDTTNDELLKVDGGEAEIQFIQCNQSGAGNFVVEVIASSLDDVRLNWLGHRFDVTSNVRIVTQSGGTVIVNTDLGAAQMVTSGTVTINSSANPAHASTHESGGGDAVTIENLTTVSTDQFARYAPDGGGGVSVVNSPSMERNTVTTTDATETTLATIAIPDDTMVVIEAWVTARRTDAQDGAVYRRTAAVFREGGGGATILGVSNTPFTEESDPTWDVDIDTSGNNARIRVTGAGGKTINWASDHFTRSVS